MLMHMPQLRLGHEQGVILPLTFMQQLLKYKYWTTRVPQRPAVACRLSSQQVLTAFVQAPRVWGGAWKLKQGE